MTQLILNNASEEVLECYWPIAIVRKGPFARHKYFHLFKSSCLGSTRANDSSSQNRRISRSQTSMSPVCWCELSKTFEKRGQNNSVRNVFPDVLKLQK